MSKKSKHKSKPSFSGKLPALNCRAFADFVRSPEWAKMKDRTLSRHPACYCCSKPAECVHAKERTMELVLGKRQNALISLCSNCMIDIGGDESGRTPPDEANAKLAKLRAAKPMATANA